MKNLLIKYKLNIEEYEAKYSNILTYVTIYIKNKKLKFKNTNNIYDIIYSFEDLINGYINHTEKDHLFELYTDDKNMFYMCIGNLPMYDKNDKKYGDYFLILKIANNINKKKFKIKTINEYLKIEDFINRYKKVEDKNILDNFYKNIYYEFKQI